MDPTSLRPAFSQRLKGPTSPCLAFSQPLKDPTSPRPASSRPQLFLLQACPASLPMICPGRSDQVRISLRRAFSGRSDFSVWPIVCPGRLVPAFPGRFLIHRPRFSSGLIFGCPDSSVYLTYWPTIFLRHSAFENRPVFRKDPGRSDHPPARIDSFGCFWFLNQILTMGCSFAVSLETASHPLWHCR